MYGKHQKYNAALASLCIAKTFDIDNPAVITDGIKNVVKNTKLQGRYEIISKQPRIILDSAHNPEGIDCLINQFKKEKNNYKDCSLLFGAMRDKNIDEMLELVKDSFNKIYFYEINYERADTDKQIDLLKKSASNAQGADKDAIGRPVDMMKTQRDMAQKALNDLKGADLATWKNHQEHVRLALQDLDRSAKSSIR